MIDSRKTLSFLCLSTAVAGCIGADPGMDPGEPELAVAQQAGGPMTHYDRAVFGGNAFPEDHYYETTEACSPGYVRSGIPATRWTSQVGGYCEFIGWNTASNPYDCHARIHARTNGSGFGGTCESWVYEQAVNLAARRPTMQSTTDYGGDASRAVDENTDGNFSDASVTHTTLEAQPWWQVDLGNSMNIGRVVVYNRTDCCAARLSNFDILVSDDGSSWRLAANYPTTPPNPVTLNVDSRGRFVRVQLRGTDYLSLAEVQVFAP